MYEDAKPMKHVQTNRGLRPHIPTTEEIRQDYEAQIEATELVGKELDYIGTLAGQLKRGQASEDALTLAFSTLRATLISATPKFSAIEPGYDVLRLVALLFDRFKSLHNQTQLNQTFLTDIFDAADSGYSLLQVIKHNLKTRLREFESALATKSVDITS